MNIASILTLTILPIVILFIIFKYCYKRCPSDKILIIYGSQNNEDGLEVLFGGAKFVYPFFQDYAFIDLEPYHLEFNRNVDSKEEKDIKLKMNIYYGVSTKRDLAINAGKRLLGLSNKTIKNLSEDIIKTEIQNVFRTKDIVEIIENIRSKDLNDEIYKRINDNLNKIGLEIITINMISINHTSINNFEEQLRQIENDYLEKSNISKLPYSERLNTNLSEINNALNQNISKRNELLTQKLKLLVQIRQ